MEYLFVNGVDAPSNHLGHIKDIFKGKVNTFEFSYDCDNIVLCNVVSQLIEFSSRHRYNLDGYIIYGDRNKYDVAKTLKCVTIVKTNINPKKKSNNIDHGVVVTYWFLVPMPRVRFSVVYFLLWVK